MRRMMVAGAAAAVALAACTGKQQGPSAIARERFVQANVDLRSVPDTAPHGDSLRAAALRRHHVTAADLRRFVSVHGRSAEYMATVWREIADSVQKRYDRSFPLVHPTHGPPPLPSTTMPNQPPGQPPIAAPNQPLAQPPIPGRPTPPPAGVQPRGPQRPHPPKIPINGGRMVPPATPPPAPMDTLRRRER